jgi:hypothetical protein
MAKCKKRGHVMKCKSIPRTWVNEDGTIHFKVYVQSYCDTCKKLKGKEIYEYNVRKHALKVFGYV